MTRKDSWIKFWFYSNEAFSVICQSFSTHCYQNHLNLACFKHGYNKTLLEAHVSKYYNDLYVSTCSNLITKTLRQYPEQKTLNWHLECIWILEIFEKLHFLCLCNFLIKKTAFDFYLTAFSKSNSCLSYL